MWNDATSMERPRWSHACARFEIFRTRGVVDMELIVDPLDRHDYT